MEAESSVDIIVAWPRNCDYPLWRWFIHQHRDFFKDIFIVFTETNQGHDYRDFIKESMNQKYEEDNITFLQNPPIKANEDWRNIAVNLALEHSESNWVWFTEQDLFVTHKAFWPMMAKYMFNYDAVIYRQGNRVHPANMWVKREYINKTTKDFGIIPDKSDHFSKFYYSLKLTGANIKTIPYPNANFYHMNGLSHNMTLLERGEKITYDPEDFLGYLEMCSLQSDLDPDFEELIAKGITKLQKQLKK